MALTHFTEFPKDWKFDGIFGFGIAAASNDVEDGGNPNCKRQSEVKLELDEEIESSASDEGSVIGSLEMASDEIRSDEFLTDIESLCESVHELIEKGPIRDIYGADLDRVVFVLNQALASELIGVLRNKRHFITAESLNAPSAAEEFLQRATEESTHADMIVARIEQLGGEPVFNADAVIAERRSAADEASQLEAVIQEDLLAQRAAIASYAQIVSWLGDGDVITRLVLEQILAIEEEHAEDLLDLIAGVNY